MTAVVNRARPRPQPEPPIENIVASCAYNPKDTVRFERSARGLRIEANSQTSMQSIVISEADWPTVRIALDELMAQPR